MTAPRYWIIAQKRIHFRVFMASHLFDMSQLSSRTPDRRDAAKRDVALVRSTCDSCGDSKIRCSREKPACRRCVRKGLTCSYSAPKRPGRPQTRKQQNATHHGISEGARSLRSTTVSSRAVSPTREASDDLSDLSGSSARTTSITSQSCVLPANPPPELLPPGDDLWTPSMLEIPSPDLDVLFGFGDFDYDASGISMHLDPLNAENGNDLHPGAHTTSVPACTTVDDVMNAVPIHPLPSEACDVLPVEGSPYLGDLASLFNFEETAENASITTMETMVHDSSDPCYCHTRALGLLAEPSPSDGLLPGECDHVETVLDRNLAATSTIADILQCRCEKDTYLLVHVSLALYKALQWYEATVSSDKAYMFPISCSGATEKPISQATASRRVIQLVLSQLPGLQKATSALDDHSEAVKRQTGARSRSKLCDLLETMIQNLKSFTRGLARKAIVRLR